MLTRYASAASSSAIVTLALLFGMHQLIALQPGAESEPRPRMPLGWLAVNEPDTPVQPEEIIRREDLTEIDPEPPHVFHAEDLETIRVPKTRPTAPKGSRLPPIGQFTDGPLVAMVRVAPAYPARAIAQEIEGFVIVEFDVTANGFVVNTVIIESSNSVFEREAIKAAQKFKFKPRIVDGVALESFGIQNLFRFSLDDR